MKKIHLLPNLITALGLSCGLFVILKASLYSYEEWNAHTLQTLILFLVLGGIADIFDGAIARILKAESPFGVQFDSFADVITFGLCPAVIMLKNLYHKVPGDWIFLAMASAMIYIFCGVLRLIRYTISANNEPSSSLIIPDKKPFIGLPIPAAAAGVTSMHLLLTAKQTFFSKYIPEEIQVIVFIITALILGYFMISRWRFPSLKTLNVDVQSFHFVFISVLLATLLFYGILHHFAVTFFGISWSYILISLLLSIVRLVVGKKSTTLVDFQMDEEE